MIRWMVNVPMRFQTFQPTMNTFPLNVKKKLWKYCVEESSIPSMHWWHRMWVIASVFIQNINRTLLCRREWRMRERKYLTIEQIKAMAFRVLSSFGSMCNIRDRNNIVCITLIWFFSLSSFRNVCAYICAIWPREWYGCCGCCCTKSS